MARFFRRRFPLADEGALVGRFGPRGVAVAAPHRWHRGRDGVEPDDGRRFHRAAFDKYSRNLRYEPAARHGPSWAETDR